MSEAIAISTARQNLSQFFDRVVKKDGERVLIARRGQKQRAALVSASYLERLEVISRSRRHAAPGTSASLRGSIEVIGDPDTVLTEIRARQNALAKAKMDRIFGSASLRRRSSE